MSATDAVQVQCERFFIKPYNPFIRVSVSLPVPVPETASVITPLDKEVSEITDAYFYSSVLSDPKKKARYDSGQDLEDLEGGFGGKSNFQSLFG